MPKEGSIEFQGVVLELLPNAMFRVKLEKCYFQESGRFLLIQIISSIHCKGLRLDYILIKLMHTEIFSLHV